MFKRFVIAALALSLAGAAPAATPPLPPGVEAKIDAAVKRDVASGRVAGVAVAILRDNKAVFVKGYGRANLELAAPVNGKTVFRIGSLTKQFTAAGVLLLAEQGKVKIDDKLSQYLPAFPRANEVTLRDLLDHTSGIHNFTESPVIDKISTSGATVNELVADIAAQSPLYDFEPGTHWWYSNSNYAILGAVIEKVSGKTWAAFMKAEIFDKLGMSDTAADDARDIVRARASGYTLIHGKAGQFRNADFTDMSVPYAAGALRSTAEDMARWHSALFGGTLLSAASLKEMLAPGRLRNGAETQTAIAWPGGKAFAPPPGYVPGPYAFGLDHHSENGRRMIGHDGSIAGFNAQMQTYADEGLTIIVLTNTDGAARPVEGELATILAPHR
ncbi:MAG TPA: serine hydrolase domain-containing protein [Candidatus Baltobacteraceae bacterium]|nr:serine hydrolase domain-containing protein [Candidatus Baltobacteraceae bacterium]